MGGERNGDRIAKRIADGIDFGRQSAAGSTDGLARSVFSRSRALLMSADDARVQHHVFVIAICRQNLEDTLETAAFAPAPEAPVDIFPVAETFRKIAPRNTRAIAIEHGLDEQPIVGRGSADMAVSAGKEVRDPPPWSSSKA